MKIGADSHFKEKGNIKMSLQSKLTTELERLFVRVFNQVTSGSVSSFGLEPLTAIDLNQISDIAENFARELKQNRIDYLKYSFIEETINDKFKLKIDLIPEYIKPCLACFALTLANNGLILITLRKAKDCSEWTSVVTTKEFLILKGQWEDRFENKAKPMIITTDN